MRGYVTLLQVNHIHNLNNIDLFLVEYINNILLNGTNVVIWALSWDEKQGYEPHIPGDSPSSVTLCEGTPYMHNGNVRIHIDGVTYV